MEKQRTFPEPQAFTNEARPPIELVAVNSSQIAAVGYDEATKTLAVTFKTKSGKPGPVYHYPNSEPRLHAEFVAAESLGKFHGKFIKDMPFKKYPADLEQPKAA
jgi:KTSC domain